jgi:hypothetical protein
LAGFTWVEVVKHVVKLASPAHRQFLMRALLTRNVHGDVQLWILRRNKAQPGTSNLSLDPLRIISSMTSHANNETFFIAISLPKL